MAATKQDIEQWIKYAKEKGYEYIISVCDTFDWEDYPVYCKDKEEVIEKTSEYNGVSMQTINEIIQIKSDGLIIKSN